jgi:hypothetical protein
VKAGLRTLQLLFLVSASSWALAAASNDVSATGMLFVTFDVGMGNHTEGVLIGRFVPDAKSLGRLPTVTTGEYPGPVKYISFELSGQALKALVGPAEAARLSHDWRRIVQVPVAAELKDYKAVVECDSRSYHATVASIKPLGEYRIASRDAAPIGC